MTAVDDPEEPKDKWLEIGRNANIQYVSTHTWDRELPVECRLFLPYYDQFKSNFECLSLIEQTLAQNEDLPEIVQIFSNLSERKKDAEPSKTRSTTFYLPTLYGAHQPSQFLFSRKLQGVKDEDLQIADDPSGAIYVKDAANCIIKHSGEHRTYSLKSLSETSWKEALTYITDEPIFPSVQIRNHEGEPIIVHPTKSHETILKEQRQRMNSL